MALRACLVQTALRKGSFSNSNRMIAKRYIKIAANINENKPTQITEKELFTPSDPDTFGTLSGKLKQTEFEETTDEGDKKEIEFLQNKPMNFQKLTIKQYSDLMKQHIEIKQIKEAIDVLEVRMLKEDRVKPNNYIYNILIGACADVGYTQKAFKLYNDMKRRGLHATGDTYTCLFNACANSPWANDGLKRAKHLRELMSEKLVEPNLTNYNVMIKAFGRCGDLPTAFELVDEMKSKNINIRVHTFNFLFQSCITDKENGLRHALIVWHKMLDAKEKPNIYSFNLLLKCIKECNFGGTEKLDEVLLLMETKSKSQLDSNTNLIEDKNIIGTINITSNTNNFKPADHKTSNKDENEIINTLVPTKEDCINVSKLSVEQNLLAKIPIIKEFDTTSLDKPETRFALVIGNQENFLAQLAKYSVKPDIKTFTQLLALLPGKVEDECKLIELMKENEIRADIDFYNMLIKKRCLRGNYKEAQAVRNLIVEENALRRKKHFLKKKLILKPNLLTYGVLAMSCKTKEDAESLLKEMKEANLKVNIEMLGAMLRQGTANFDFGYVLFIMKRARDEKLPINEIFLNHLKNFKQICRKNIGIDEKGKMKCTKPFVQTFGIYKVAFERWLGEVNLEKALSKENPWTQFKENQPETFQRRPVKIEVTKHYKPKKFVKPYTALV